MKKIIYCALLYCIYNNGQELASIQFFPIVSKKVNELNAIFPNTPLEQNNNGNCHKLTPFQLSLSDAQREFDRLYYPGEWETIKRNQNQQAPSYSNDKYSENNPTDYSELYDNEYLAPNSLNTNDQTYQYADVNDLSQFEHDHATDTYRCLICKRTGFHDDYKVKRHVEIHSKSAERKYKCDHCEKTGFRSQHRLDQHIKIIHSELFKCSLCGFQGTPQSYNTHIKEHTSTGNKIHDGTQH